MPSRFALTILAAALSISPLAGQIRAGSGTAGFGISAGPAGTGSSASGAMAGFAGRGVVGGAVRFHQARSAGRSSILLPYPYFYSESDYAYAPESSQPQIVVIPASAPAPPPEPPAPRESLLIEWQGDRFVRTTMSAKDSAAGQIAPDYSEKSVVPSPAGARAVAGRQVTVQAPRVLPPAILVFHDGRKEELTEYTIMSGTIYSNADYWTTGSWTRKIQIADLDVPATMKLNQQRGLKFMLPSSPNEIIIRP